MERIKNIALILFLAVFVALLCINVHHCTTKQGRVYRDTVRTTFVDTIPYYKPVPKDSVVIRYITQRLPVVDEKEDNFPNKGNNKEQNIPQSGNNAPENIIDSVDVILPITQNVYRDSTYTAYVSGYQPKLDSILVYPKTEIITITEKAKQKRWSVGFQVGYGVNVRGTPEFFPYVGVGITYNLFSF